MIAFENTIFKCEISNENLKIIDNLYYFMNINGELIQYNSGDNYSNDIFIIEDKRTQLKRKYVFKKELDFIDNIVVSSANEKYCILHFERSYHLIFLNDFLVYSFPGNEIHYFGDYILFKTEEAYIDCTSISYINIITRKREILNWFIDFIAKFEGYVGLNSIIRNGILEFEGNNQKYFYNLERISHPLVNDEILRKCKIESDKFSGFFIDYHSISSTLNADGSFTTLRTKVGELLYRYKYNFDLTTENELAELVSSFIIKHFPYCEVIIPIPPSNLKRPYQPLLELTQKISEITRIPCNLNYLKKKQTIPLKSINDNIARQDILRNAFYIPDNRYRSKNILLIDDLFRSGETLNAAVNVLKKKGEIFETYVLAITKTRTKK